MSIKSIGIIGGDIRMVYAGKQFEKSGYTVKYSGFEKVDRLTGCKIEETVECDSILFPIPPTRDFENIAMPLSNDVLPINRDLAEMLRDKAIFCGMPDRLQKFGGMWDKLKYYDYGIRDDFTVKNAILTADATVQIIKSLVDTNLSQLSILVLGFGRVGKACAMSLLDEKADIYIGARKNKDFIDIKNLGFKTENSENILFPKNYKIIVNTVPFLLLDKAVLEKLNRDTIIIDLASGKGGVDFKEAEKLNINAVHSLGLPGKYYPKQAGKIIKETIDEIIKEDAL